MCEDLFSRSEGCPGAFVWVRLMLISTIIVNYLNETYVKQNKINVFVKLCYMSYAITRTLIIEVESRVQKNSTVFSP